ncbi:PIH1 domain-containing protein 2 [Physocladia obscura]|uniref:PIH1 domain-containing protein 2 n=1 Tax=Physocladia obscura TaxID=109957 RepID=A0AAD5TBN4_9FUNG|nr:PIH1 domain-containing protein 2 [Physocladia obscura]
MADPMNGFTPEELMQKGSKIWKHLDTLAATNPQAYQEFIKNVADDAKKNCDANSFIDPGFYLETKESDTSSFTLSRPYFVNIAVTSKLPAPSENDPLNIPICISEIRTGTDKWCKVIDAVVNPKVLEKTAKDPFFKSDLINLVVDCIKETHGVSLKKRTHKITDGEYKGPIGWDDKGRALTDAQIDELSDRVRVVSVAESVEDEAGVAQIKIPSGREGTKNLKGKSPVIEVVGACTNAEHVAGFKQKETETHIIFTCNLPGTSSQTEISICKSSNDNILISSASDNFEIPITFEKLKNCNAKNINFSVTTEQHK